MANTSTITQLNIEAASATYDATKYDWPTRREMLLAALELNPTDPLNTLQSQHSAVVAKAIVRHTAGTR
jgi:hypothetical protein